MRDVQRILNARLFGHLMFRCMNKSDAPFVRNDDGEWVQYQDLFNWRTFQLATISDKTLRRLPDVKFGWTSVLVVLCLESNGKRKIKMKLIGIRGGWTSNELDDKVNIEAYLYAQQFHGVVNWGHLSFPVFPKVNEDAFLDRLEKLVDIDKFWNEDGFKQRPT
jgi:hypothetical protein